MQRWLSVCWMAAWLSGMAACSASYLGRDADQSYYQPPPAAADRNAGGLPQVAEEALAQESSLRGARMMSYGARSKVAPGSAVATSVQAKQQSVPPQPAAKQPGSEKKTEVEPPEPLVVYSGYLKLRVRRLLDAVDRITGITEQSGGYVQSLTSRVVIVRIPATDFEKVMDTLAAIGEVLDRRVKALDVTAQYTDLAARLAVAREARNRLLALLEKVESVEERLRILQEIKRLSEQIESVESTLTTLRQLVDYFTITLELEPVVQERQTLVHRSPFGWVRELAPQRTTIEEGRRQVVLELPKGFVLFEKDEAFRAQAADTTTLRVGSVNNEPRGDAAYWSDAVFYELEGRDEEQVAAGQAGTVAYRLFRSKDLQPIHYLVGLRDAGERLFVIEAFFPNQQAYQDHGAAVIEALKSFQVK